MEGERLLARHIVALSGDASLRRRIWAESRAMAWPSGARARTVTGRAGFSRGPSKKAGARQRRRRARAWPVSPAALAVDHAALAAQSVGGAGLLASTFCACPCVQARDAVVGCSRAGVATGRVALRVAGSVVLQGSEGGQDPRRYPSDRGCPAGRRGAPTVLASSGCAWPSRAGATAA